MILQSEKGSGVQLVCSTWYRLRLDQQDGFFIPKYGDTTRKDDTVCDWSVIFFSPPELFTWPA